MALPPGVQVVSRIPAPGGGEWVLGSDGGVFAVGGANFYGAYTTLPDQARQGDRGGWARIDPTVEGGYMLTSARGETYHFNPPPIQRPEAPTAPTAPVPQAPPTGPAQGEDISGSKILENALAQYGLQDLGKELLDYYRGPAGGSIEATYIRMRETDQYKKRFSGMEARRAAGYAPISEEAYIAWEGAAKSLFNHYSLPPEFYDTPEELASFIAGDVSPTELKTRIEDGYVAAFNAPPEVRNALQEMYGVDAPSLAAFFLDPQAGEKVIQKKWTAAQIGGQATKSGFGALTKEEAEALSVGGMSVQEAQQRFGILGEQSELFGMIPGEVAGGVTREEQLAAAGGDIAAQKKIERRGQERTAAFQGGGGFAGGQTGLTGLGEAQ